MNKLIGLSLYAWLGLSFGSSRADVWYVATNGSDTADGTTWETAYATISNALAQANASEGNEVWVSNGTYALTEELDLDSGVRLWGVYGAGQTVLNGGKATRCVYITDGILDGFTVTNGYTTYGGGIYIAQGQVLNCTVTGNEALNYGGGLYGPSSGSGVISNCVIAGNVATNITTSYGGGAYCAGGGWQVLDCPSIRDNQANGRGGGIYMDGASVIAHSTLADNFAGFQNLCYGGGLNLQTGGVISNCLIVGNTIDPASATSANGGGIFAHSGSLVTHCTILSNVAHSGGGVFAENSEVRHCPEIAYNTADGTAANDRGGGLYTRFSSAVSDCTIRHNSSASDGGGAYVMVDNAGTAVVNCVVSDNTAGSKAGGLQIASAATVRNSLFTRNVASGSGGGGGLYLGSHNGRAENCTVVSNWSDYRGGGLYSAGTNTLVNCIIYSNLASSASWPDYYEYFLGINPKITEFQHCCTPTAASLLGTNNIPDEPEFAAPESGNWRLTVASPCVNAGTNEPWVESAVDLDGHARADRYSRQVDIGAYEYIPAGTMFQLR